MTRVNLEQILSSLPSLSKPELNQIKARVIFLLGSTSSPATNVSIQQTESYLKNVILLYSKKYVEVPRREALEKNDPYQEDTKLNLICKEIEDLSKSLSLDRKETLKISKVLLECADAKLTASGKPKSFRLLLNYLADPKSLLQESFPGYVGTYLFRSIVLGL